METHEKLIKELKKDINNYVEERIEKFINDFLELIIENEYKPCEMSNLLKTPIEDLNLSVRTYNCFNKNKIKYLGQIAILDISDLMILENFGNASLREITKILTLHGLTFNMNLIAYGFNKSK
jgi:DNA-directed RNA polymerase subunit alpha